MAAQPPPKVEYLLLNDAALDDVDEEQHRRPAERANATLACSSSSACSSAPSPTSATYTTLIVGLAFFGPASFWSWVIGGTLQVFVAAVAELVSAYPLAGGVIRSTSSARRSNASAIRSAAIRLVDRPSPRWRPWPPSPRAWCRSSPTGSGSTTCPAPSRCGGPWASPSWPASSTSSASAPRQP